jgi:hypothetical protein
MVALQNTLAADRPMLSLRLVYRQVGLTAFTILGIDDCSKLESDFALARRRDAEVKKLATLAKDVEAAPRRKRRKSDDGDHGPRPKGGDADHGLPDVDAEEVGGLFEVGSEISLQDVEEGMLDEDALADAELMADVPPDAPPPRVIFDRVAGRLYENDGQPKPNYLGRVSIVNEGTTKEAFSIYCTRHGCSIMKRIKHAPNDDAIVKWFEDGLDMPKGHSAFLQSNHKGMLALPGA